MAKTELQKMITEKWFLSIEKLAEQAGVPLLTVKRAIRGEEIKTGEQKLLEFMKKL